MPTSRHQPPGPAGASPSQQRELVSVVVPLFNERATARAMYERLAAVFDGLPAVDAELVFVDDGSRDGTLELLHEVAADDRRVRVIGLSRNFGHQAAITAGLDHASGDAVVLIDGDLQDPPEVIPEMLERWRAGADVVYGARRARRGESAFKRATAKLFYRIIGRLSDTSLPYDAGDFRLLDRAVADVLRDMREEARYLRGMVAWAGFRQEALPYERDERFAGETKYSLRKMTKLGFDGLASFSSRPLVLAAQLGALITVGAFIYLVWIVANRLTNPHSVVAGWTSVLVAILFLGGVQLLSIGILGVYVGRVFGETKHRPLYVVARRASARVARERSTPERQATPEREAACAPREALDRQTSERERDARRPLLPLR
jgi:glycosyltransferase involved in cell wall biosynthesis